MRFAGLVLLLAGVAFGEHLGTVQVDTLHETPLCEWGRICSFHANVSLRLDEGHGKEQMNASTHLQLGFSISQTTRSPSLSLVLLNISSVAVDGVVQPSHSLARFPAFLTVQRGQKNNHALDVYFAKQSKAAAGGEVEDDARVKAALLNALAQQYSLHAVDVAAGNKNATDVRKKKGPAEYAFEGKNEAGSFVGEHTVEVLNQNKINSTAAVDNVKLTAKLTYQSSSPLSRFAKHRRASLITLSSSKKHGDRRVVYVRQVDVLRVGGEEHQPANNDKKKKDGGDGLVVLPNLPASHFKSVLEIARGAAAAGASGAKEVSDDHAVYAGIRKAFSAAGGADVDVRHHSLRASPASLPVSLLEEDAEEQSEEEAEDDDLGRDVVASGRPGAAIEKCVELLASEKVTMEDLLPLVHVQTVDEILDRASLLFKDGQLSAVSMQHVYAALGASRLPAATRALLQAVGDQSLSNALRLQAAVALIPAVGEAPRGESTIQSIADLGAAAKDNKDEFVGEINLLLGALLAHDLSGKVARHQLITWGNELTVTDPESVESAPRVAYLLGALSNAGSHTAASLAMRFAESSIPLVRAAALEALQQFREQAKKKSHTKKNKNNHKGVLFVDDDAASEGDDDDDLYSSLPDLDLESSVGGGSSGAAIVADDEDDEDDDDDDDIESSNSKHITAAAITGNQKTINRQLGYGRVVLAKTLRNSARLTARSHLEFDYETSVQGNLKGSVRLSTSALGLGAPVMESGFVGSASTKLPKDVHSRLNVWLKVLGKTVTTQNLAVEDAEVQIGGKCPTVQSVNSQVSESSLVHAVQVSSTNENEDDDDDDEKNTLVTSIGQSAITLHKQFTHHRAIAVLGASTVRLSVRVTGSTLSTAVHTAALNCESSAAKNDLVVVGGVVPRAKLRVRISAHARSGGKSGGAASVGMSSSIRFSGLAPTFGVVSTSGVCGFSQAVLSDRHAATAHSAIGASSLQKKPWQHLILSWKENTNKHTSRNLLRKQEHLCHRIKVGDFISGRGAVSSSSASAAATTSDLAVDDDLQTSGDSKSTFDSIVKSPSDRRDTLRLLSKANDPLPPAVKYYPNVNAPQENPDGAVFKRPASSFTGGNVGGGSAANIVDDMTNQNRLDSQVLGDSRQATQQLGSLKKDVVQQGQRTGDAVNSQGSRVRDTVHNVGQNLRDSAGQQWREADKMVQSGADSLQNTVRSESKRDRSTDRNSVSSMEEGAIAAASASVQNQDRRVEQRVEAGAKSAEASGDSELERVRKELQEMKHQDDRSRMADLLRRENGKDADQDQQIKNMILAKEKRDREERWKKNEDDDSKKVMDALRRQEQTREEDGQFKQLKSQARREASAQEEEFKMARESDKINRELSPDKVAKRGEERVEKKLEDFRDQQEQARMLGNTEKRVDQAVAKEEGIKEQLGDVKSEIKDATNREKNAERRMKDGLESTMNNDLKKNAIDADGQKVRDTARNIQGEKAQNAALNGVEKEVKKGLDGAKEEIRDDAKQIEKQVANDAKTDKMDHQFEQLKDTTKDQGSRMRDASNEGAKLEQSALKAGQDARTMDKAVKTVGHEMKDIEKVASDAERKAVKDVTKNSDNAVDQMKSVDSDMSRNQDNAAEKMGQEIQSGLNKAQRADDRLMESAQSEFDHQDKFFARQQQQDGKMAEKLDKNVEAQANSFSKRLTRMNENDDKRLNRIGERFEEKNGQMQQEINNAKTKATAKAQQKKEEMGQKEKENAKRKETPGDKDDIKSKQPRRVEQALKKQIPHTSFNAHKNAAQQMEPDSSGHFAKPDGSFPFENKNMDGLENRVLNSMKPKDDSDDNEDIEIADLQVSDSADLETSALENSSLETSVEYSEPLEPSEEDEEDLEIAADLPEEQRVLQRERAISSEDFGQGANIRYPAYWEDVEYSEPL